MDEIGNWMESVARRVEIISSQKGYKTLRHNQERMGEWELFYGTSGGVYEE